MIPVVRTLSGTFSGALPLLPLFLLPGLAAAQHFGTSFVDVRLVRPDSIHVTVSTERQDMMNVVDIYPHVEGGKYDEPYRVYQARAEAYLQMRVPVRADGKKLYLRAVSWKKGGRDRDDGLDSASVRETYHAITLGGKLPAETAVLSVRADLWMERTDKPEISLVEYSFAAEDGVVLRRLWRPTERTVRFPLHPDSLSAMRTQSPPPGNPRGGADHAGHDH